MSDPKQVFVVEVTLTSWQQRYLRELLKYLGWTLGIVVWLALLLLDIWATTAQQWLIVVVTSVIVLIMIVALLAYVEVTS